MVRHLCVVQEKGAETGRGLPGPPLVARTTVETRIAILSLCTQRSAMKPCIRILGVTTSLHSAMQRPWTWWNEYYAKPAETMEYLAPCETAYDTRGHTTYMIYHSPSRLQRLC